ncbi:MAG: hypothetical protein FWH17_01225 [Oscillospiraceae bacterium]|nr:hypothetical protein [Oscillospiraceae bacterium]
MARRYVPNTYYNRRFLRLIVSIIITVVLSFLILFLILFFIFQGYVVDGQLVGIPWLDGASVTDGNSDAISDDASPSADDASPVTDNNDNTPAAD